MHRSSIPSLTLSLFALLLVLVVAGCDSNDNDDDGGDPAIANITGRWEGSFTLANTDYDIALDIDDSANMASIELGNLTGTGAISYGASTDSVGLSGLRAQAAASMNIVGSNQGVFTFNGTVEDGGNRLNGSVGLSTFTITDLVMTKQ